MSADVVKQAELGDLGALLGRGGEGAVYLVPDLRLPDIREPLVYKQFRTAPPRVGALAGVIAARSRLDPRRRGELDRVTVWPLRMVEGPAGTVDGIVMRVIPDAFMYSPVLPSGAVRRTTRSAQLLMIPDERTERLGLPPVSLPPRLAICREFARVVALLHAMNVVLGDISPRNVLFSLRRAPAVLVTDCDGMRMAGEMPAATQLHTPDWDPPEREPSSVRSDRYKLGLFILRVLAAGSPSSRSRVPVSTSRDPEIIRDVLDARGMRLLRATLADPAGRTSAAEWIDYFTEHLGEPADTSGRRSHG